MDAKIFHVKGLKLISLSIPADEPYREFASSDESASLRDTSQWFPDIPSESLCLNESQFQAMNYMTRPYWPLLWIHFGGPGGIYLLNVIALSAWVLDGKCCTGIEIEYDSEVQGVKVHTLGMCGPLSEDLKSTLSTKVNVKEEKITFNIDGPNGEFITGVHMGSISENPSSPEFLEVGTSRFLLIKYSRASLSLFI